MKNKEINEINMNTNIDFPMFILSTYERLNNNGQNNKLNPDLVHITEDQMRKYIGEILRVSPELARTDIRQFILNSSKLKDLMQNYNADNTKKRNLYFCGGKNGNNSNALCFFPSLFPYPNYSPIKRIREAWEREKIMEIRELQ